jgi:hypothetical protein
MSGQPPPSSHSGIPPQPINPYEPSGTRVKIAALASKVPAGRHYQSRLDWRDRHALLRSVAPGRVAVVLSAIVWLKECYEHIAVWGAALRDDYPLFGDPLAISRAVLAVFWMALGVFALYMCWLEWTYCDRLQAAAGGRGTWRPWSSLHFRIAWLSAALSVLTIAVAVGGWLIIRWEMAEGLSQIGP